MYKRQIKNRIISTGKQEPSIDIILVELGGTVGDIESGPFLEAAKLTDTYESLKESYVDRDEPIEELKPPKLIDPYQLISTDNGVVISYIPEDYSEEIFKLGCSFQKCIITADNAKSIAQNVLNKICFELEINKDIDVLDFLETDSEENICEKVENKSSPEQEKLS